MATANDKLRTARERTASLTYPDECLSRQELAELANAWIWNHHNKMSDELGRRVDSLLTTDRSVLWRSMSG